MSSSEQFYIGAYWGDRAEELTACSKRIVSFLKHLSAVETAFSKWYEIGGSHKSALKKKIDVSEGFIENLLLKGRIRTDIDRSVMVELGYNVGLWNGLSEEEGTVGLSISCGISANNPNLVNSLVIRLPAQGQSAQRILQHDVILGILREVVVMWEPSWAVVSSSGIREVSAVKQGTPHFAWILFLEKQRGMIPTLDSPSQVDCIDGYGNTIIITPEQFDISCKEHIRTLKAVYKQLRKGGLLKPVE